MKWANGPGTERSGHSVVDNGFQLSGTRLVTHSLTGILSMNGTMVTLRLLAKLREYALSLVDECVRRGYLPAPKNTA